MSHVVTINTQVKDAQAVAAACQRLRLPAPQSRTARLFSQEVTGLVVELPEWRFPVVCHLDSGQLSYDNFNGLWGEEAELHRFVQAYAVEKATLEATRQGYSVQEQSLPDGSIRLQVAVH